MNQPAYSFSSLSSEKFRNVMVRMKVRMSKVMKEHSVCIQFMIGFMIHANIIFMLFGLCNCSPVLLLTTAKNHPKYATDCINNRTDYENDLPLFLCSLFICIKKLENFYQKGKIKILKLTLGVRTPTR